MIASREAPADARTARARAFVARSLLAASTVIAGAGASTAALSGCSCAATSSWGGSSARFTATRTTTVPHETAKPLVVTTGNGDITVTRSGTDTVTIVAKLKAKTQERLDAVTIVTSRLEDGTLDVRAQWPNNKREHNEGCSFEVQIPDATNVTLDTANGGIRAGGLAGVGRFDTSNGDITIDGHAGRVVADTSNGGIVVNDVPECNADTSNGDIRVRLTDAGAGPVVASSSNGSVTLVVGGGFSGVVSCDTSNGGVSCTVPGAKTLKKTRTSGTYSFGSTDAGSTSLSTSNGDVTIISR